MGPEAQGMRNKAQTLEVFKGTFAKVVNHMDVRARLRSALQLDKYTLIDTGASFRVADPDPSEGSGASAGSGCHLGTSEVVCPIQVGAATLLVFTDGG